MEPATDDRPLTSAEMSEIARVPLAEGWTYDRPICIGETCACGQRGDEIARGTFYFHARCVRVVASRVVAAKVEALTALAASAPPSSPRRKATTA